LVRIHTLTERNFYSTIAAVDCVGIVAATVTLNTAIPAQCNANGGWIAPVNTLRYSAVNATGDEAGRQTNRNVVLRRTELDPANKANALLQAGGNVPVDDRDILDYTVLFNVGFMMTDNGSPNTVNFVAAPLANVIVRPEQVRGVIIDLAARTPEHEPEFSNIVNGLAFRVLATPGAARVRQAHAEILLPNIANRGF
jgi:hypothetical protein